MPAEARLQGSCCSPMDLHRYGEQVEGLKAFIDIDLIPPDPYDIPAPLAARLLQLDETALTPQQQAAYDDAMRNSNEGGPCCCRCWRWAVYGGLAKHLIRDRGFSGEQIARIWDLSDGCGGTTHVHCRAANRRTPAVQPGVSAFLCPAWPYLPVPGNLRFGFTLEREAASPGG